MSVNDLNAFQHVFHEAIWRKQIKLTRDQLYIIPQDFAEFGYIRFSDEKELLRFLAFVSDWSEHIILLTNIFKEFFKSAFNDKRCVVPTEKSVQNRIQHTIDLLNADNEIKNHDIKSFLESTFENLIRSVHITFAVCPHFGSPKITTKLKGLFIDHEDAAKLLRQVDVIHRFCDVLPLIGVCLVYPDLGYDHKKEVQKRLTFEFKAFAVEELKNFVSFVLEEINRTKLLFTCVEEDFGIHQTFLWSIIKGGYLRRLYKSEKDVKRFGKFMDIEIGKL